MTAAVSAVSAAGLISRLTAGPDLAQWLLSTHQLRSALCLISCTSTSDDLQGVSGFLKKSDAGEAAGSLKAGALLEVVVQSATDKRLVAVTARPDAVAGATLKDDTATDLGEALLSILPFTSTIEQCILCLVAVMAAPD